LAVCVVDRDALPAEGYDGEQRRALHIARLAGWLTLSFTAILGIPPVLVVGIALVGIGSPIPIMPAAPILRSRGVSTHGNRSDERKGRGGSKASSKSELRVHSLDLETSNPAVVLYFSCAANSS